MKNVILVVDDMEINRDILEEILEDEYQVLKASDGEEALAVLRERSAEIAALLLDLHMPRLDGFGVLEAMRQEGILGKVPVLVITGEDSMRAEKKCFDMGVSDFIRKPFDVILVQCRVRNIVNLFLYKNDLEQLVDEQTKTLQQQNTLLQRQADKLRESNDNIIDLLGNVVEFRNLESGEHVMRVKTYTRILARQVQVSCPAFGLTDEAVQIMTVASALHDVGKIAIPDHILLKPGQLTPEEFDCMKTHTTKGCEIIDQIKDIWDLAYAEMSYAICRYHHERYDGRGYPDGLKGEEIPIAAQIVSVADVYDALVHERVYKSAVPKDEAVQMILQGQCGAFSEQLLGAFVQVKEKFAAVS